MSIYVFGHKNPDTDSIASAIAAADLLTQNGENATPAMQGDMTPEAEFVLKRFGLGAPEKIESVAGKDVAIVDTMAPNQLPADIDGANVKYVFDHHQLGGLKTAAPLAIWARPIGSTASVLYFAYKYFGREIPKAIAGAMLGAVLSDTMLFKSPTTTQYDREAAENLAKTAGVKDIEALGLEMLKIKSSIENDSADTLVRRDFKEIDVSGKLFGIGQIELVDLAMFDAKKAAVKERLRALKGEKKYFGVLFIIVDIMKEGSILLSFTDDDAKVAGALGTKIADGESEWIPGLMSRKKQVVPPLTEAF